MISPTQIKTLMNNWTIADTMDCKAIIRAFDPLSKWECYITAIDPEDEDIIKCLIFDGRTMSVDVWSLRDLKECYNQHGEPVQIDEGFVPRSALTIFKRYYETRRN